MKAKFTVPYMIGGIIALNMISSIGNQTAAKTNDTIYKIDSMPHVNIARNITAADTNIVDIDWDSLPPQAVRVLERNKDVLYIMNTGDTIRRSGGTRAWRNMNPGCLRYADFARENGAIGECGRFAVFPDEETGRAALVALLRTDTYNKLSIARAISKYAPPHENNVALYRRKLKKLTGLPLDTRLSRLDSAGIAKVADAICQIEGWREGKVMHMSTPNTMLAQMRERSISDSTQRTL